MSSSLISANDKKQISLIESHLSSIEMALSVAIEEAILLIESKESMFKTNQNNAIRFKI